MTFTDDRCQTLMPQFLLASRRLWNLVWSSETACSGVYFSAQNHNSFLTTVVSLLLSLWNGVRNLSQWRPRHYQGAGGPEGV